MKKFTIVLIALLSLNGLAYGQGTQINGNQIKDDTIMGTKIKSNAAILWSKLDFTGFNLSTIGAEHPLTFTSPLIRSTNTISLGTVSLTSGGLGITSVPVGRIPFGLNSSQLTTNSKLEFDSANGRLTINSPSAGSFNLDVSGTGRFSSNLSINGADYTWPGAIGAAGTVLTDVAGDGILSWQPTATSGVTLQASDPGTPDTGGINITGNIYVGTDADIGGVLGFQTITRPTDTWTGGTLPSAQVWNTATSGVDQASTGTSQQAIVWADAAEGYVANFASNSGTLGNGILVQSQTPTGRLITGSTGGSDKFILFNTGNFLLAPDNAGLPEAWTAGASPAFINMGSVAMDPTAKFGIRSSITSATGFTAADTWVGVDSELNYTGTESLSTLRGAIFRTAAAGDVTSAGRGIFAAMILGGTTTQASPEINGARFFADLIGSSTKTVTDVSGLRAEVFLEGGTNNITNSYGLYLENYFKDGTAATVGTAYGIKLLNTWDANTTVTQQYGLYYQHKTAGTATSTTAIHIEDVGSGANDYAIYSAGGKSEFVGAVKAGWLALPIGAPVADAATITPTGPIFHVTGTGTPIATINLPYSGFTGTITLIADDAGGFATTTGGNIAVGSTVTQNHTIAVTYDGSSWFPNY